MNIAIPELSLVVLVGASGSGKSTFARKHFKATEILSSDFFRAMLSDDENDQTVTPGAFELLHLAAGKRLENNKLTVIDATNVQPESRRQCLEVARRFHVQPVAIVFHRSEAVCLEHNQNRVDRQVPTHVIRGHIQQLKRSLNRLRDEGFRRVYILESEEEIQNAVLVREPLPVNRKQETGPFDIIGDVHGCLEELKELLRKLGYTETAATWLPPEGRKAIFVGDLVDRGPDTPGVLRLVMQMIDAGHALCVRGNHDDKLARKLKGREVSISHGLAESLQQLESQSPEFRNQIQIFLDNLVSHYVLDNGKLVVAHAGLKEHLQGRMSERVRAFALYGDTTGESDEFGLPIRLNWAADYRGKAMVVYGHTPVLQPEWLNRCICIDTGCVFGGSLTALRYPERELVSVPAFKTYAETKRFVATPASEQPVPTTPIGNAQQQADDVLDLADVSGKRIINTPWMNNITIREGQAAAAMEMLSRFAVNPRWLIYLPPTMSPCATSAEGSYLEHPQQAFDYYAKQDVKKVICEQKHMGSRAIVLIGREEAAIQKRFGISGEGFGICLTRTGRRFFEPGETETAFLSILQDALTKADFWNRFASDWFCLDGELMPWSAKAQELLRLQYAAAGCAGTFALRDVLASLASDRSDLQSLRTEMEQRQHNISKFVDAYRGYCWKVDSPTDLRYAPFHLLASEGKVHTDQDHLWHMTTLAELASHPSGVLLATPYQLVELNDPSQVQQATQWWIDLTNQGGEGVVVKPLPWLQRGNRGLVQPAVKVRGPEYLRLIYGPDYTMPHHLQRLRQRGLGMKQSLGLREFVLSIEALHRFIRHEPLRMTHECIFGLLALESEPIDPRL